MAGANEKEEEKAMEFAALTAIYEDVFELIAEYVDGVSYQFNFQEPHASLRFMLDAKYPYNIPVIKAHSHGNRIVQLEEMLNICAQNLCGEVMIYTLVEEAKQWLHVHKDELQEETTEKQEGNLSEVLCKFFLEGKCKFGDKCFNKHATHKTEHVECEVEEPVVSVNKEAIKTNAQQATSKDEVLNSKKKSMKTATDVISRILWDDQLDKSDFCVGYLDRFVGILERPFSEFSWEDLASVDYNVLAIPKHRIQYFKYRGRIVWDKRERVDLVFGSTGSGETILDLISDQSDKNVTDEEHVKEENFIIEEIEDDAEVLRRKERKSGKPVPNYYIAFKVHDEDVLDKVCKLQREAIEKEHLLSDGFIPPQQLHITLLMLTLTTEDQISKSIDILKGVQHVIPTVLPQTSQIQFKGVGSFKDRILYINTTPNSQLQKIVEILKRKFQKAGINLNGNREEFHPHLSILRAPHSKISPARCRDVFANLEKLYRDADFSSQGVEYVILYSRFGAKELDGAHERIVCLENSLLAVCPTLPRIIQDHMSKLGKKEYDLNAGLTLEQSLENLAEFSAKIKENDGRLLVIMRGIPGCGKSFLLGNCTEASDAHGLGICSTKHLFHRAGNQKFDESELNIARGYCRTRFLESLVSPAKIIVVDDCHPRCWQYAFYQKIAHAFGITCRVIEITCTKPETIRRCQEYVNSGISIQEILEMSQEWESDPKATKIEPWFENFKLQQGVSFSLKDLLDGEK